MIDNLTNFCLNVIIWKSKILFPFLYFLCSVCVSEYNILRVDCTNAIQRLRLLN